MKAYDLTDQQTIQEIADIESKKQLLRKLADELVENKQFDKAILQLEELRDLSYHGGTDPTIKIIPDQNSDIQTWNDIDKEIEYLKKHNKG